MAEEPQHIHSFEISCDDRDIVWKKFKGMAKKATSYRALESKLMTCDCDTVLIYVFCIIESQIHELSSILLVISYP
jgi:hypothetical protein